MSVLSDSVSLCSLQSPDLLIDKPAIPKALPEVPHPACISIEKAKEKKIANRKVNKRAQIR